MADLRGPVRIGTAGSKLEFQGNILKPSLPRDMLVILASSAYVLVLLNFGNVLYIEIYKAVLRMLDQPSTQVPVAGAIESMAYLAGGLVVGLIASRRGFIYGAAIPVVVGIAVYVWYVPLGHAYIPPEVRERYHYPFWMYLLPIFAWLIPTGIGGMAGVLLAKRVMETNERNRRSFMLAAILVIPQIAAWCYVAHSIMWSSASYALQAIEFVPATLAFVTLGYATTRSTVKPNAALLSTR